MSNPQAGKWEMPGGHIEENENPQQAAIREWEEEVGLQLPAGEIVGKWDGSNGRYVGFVYEIEHEADLDLWKRNRDGNPDGDHFEAVAWVNPLDLHNHNLRYELMDDLGRVQGVLIRNSQEEHQEIHHPPIINLPKYTVWEEEALDTAWKKLDRRRGVTNARKKQLPKHKVAESTIHPETTSILKRVGIESHHHLLHVLGAPTELEISRHEVTPKKFGGYTFVNSIVRGPHYGMERDIDPYNKDVYNQRFIVRHQGGGIGTKVFAAQVHHLTNLGFNNIHAIAARNDAKGEIGYKVWPKMGYNGEFSAKEKKILPKQYRHADSILHLYSMPGGRDWWEKNGWEKRMSFDLAPNSESHKTFQEYLQRKQQK